MVDFKTYLKFKDDPNKRVIGSDVQELGEDTIISMHPDADPIDLAHEIGHTKLKHTSNPEAIKGRQLLSEATKDQKLTVIEQELEAWAFAEKSAKRTGTPVDPGHWGTNVGSYTEALFPEETGPRSTKRYVDWTSKEMSSNSTIDIDDINSNNKSNIANDPLHYLEKRYSGSDYRKTELDALESLPDGAEKNALRKRYRDTELEIFEELGEEFDNEYAQYFDKNKKVIKPTTFEAEPVSLGSSEYTFRPKNTQHAEATKKATPVADDVAKAAAKQGDNVAEGASKLKGKGGYLIAAALVGATIWGIASASNKSKERKRRANHGADLSNQASQMHRYL